MHSRARLRPRSSPSTRPSCRQRKFSARSSMSCTRSSLRTKRSAPELRTCGDVHEPHFFVRTFCYSTTPVETTVFCGGLASVRPHYWSQRTSKRSLGSFNTRNDDSADPLITLRATIAAQMAAARQRKSKRAPTVVVYLDTTQDYGCLCPPFVLAPFYNAGEGGFIWPRFARGVTAAPAPKGGLFRFAGHFEGRAISGYQAEGRRAPKRQGAVDEAEPDPRLERHPAFFVETWCFEPSPTISQSTFENYRDQLKALANQGRFCVGSNFPVVTP